MGEGSTGSPSGGNATRRLLLRPDGQPPPMAAGGPCGPSSRIVMGAKFEFLNNILKAAVRLRVVRTTTLSHSAEHHAQIICGHFGDNRSRESNGLRDRGNRFKISQTPGRIAIAKAPVEYLIAPGRCYPFA